MREAIRSRAAGGSGPLQRGRSDKGQATVEFVLVLPILFLLVLAVVQTAVILRDQVLLTHAAREAAREAAVHDDRGAPRKAALARSGLDSRRLTVEVTGQRAGSRRVRAELTYRVPTKVAVVGLLVPDVTLRADAAMRREGL